MEDIIQTLVTQGPIGIVCAAVVYIIVYLQRKSTGDKRDKQIAEQDKRIALLESEIESIKALDIAGRLASIETSLKYIQMLLEDKERFK